MSDFYQLNNSSNDFKSRLNNVFDQLGSLEKQHDVQAKTAPPLIVVDDETGSPAATRNPSIPEHAIVFKKRPAEEETTFSRPQSKWKKYDLADVNDHQMNEAGNRHALNDFFRTRAPPVEAEAPVFKRPMKKEVLNAAAAEDDEQYIPIRVPQPLKSTEKKSDDDNDDINVYKLKSTQKKTRGVLSTTKKEPIKTSMDTTEEKDNDDDVEEEDDEDADELFEP